MELFKYIRFLFVSFSIDRNNRGRYGNNFNDDGGRGGYDRGNREGSYGGQNRDGGGGGGYGNYNRPRDGPRDGPPRTSDRPAASTLSEYFVSIRLNLEFDERRFVFWNILFFFACIDIKSSLSNSPQLIFSIKIPTFFLKILTQFLLNLGNMNQLVVVVVPSKSPKYKKKIERHKQFTSNLT